MLYFLQAHDLKTIRCKLIVLYILNVSDALLTYLLIQTGYFCEINYLLKGVVVKMGELSIIKMLLPAALIAWLYIRIQHAAEKQLELGNIAVNSVFLLYIFVNMLHLAWTAYFLAAELAFV